MLTTDKFQKYFFYFLPLSLVFSIFVADFIIFLTSIIFLSSQIFKKNYRIFSNKYFIFFLLFWFYLIINSIFSYDIKLSLSRSLPYLRFGILFLALSYMLTLDNFRNNFLKLVLFLLIIVCIDANIQFFFGTNLFGYSAHISRISSFFNDELVLGGFLLKMYPIFLISLVFLKKKYSLSTFLSCFLLFLFFFSIFLSGERTAFFNFLLLNILLFIILFKKKYFKYLLFFLVSLIILVFFIQKNNSNVLERYLSIKEIFNNKTITIFSKTHESHYKSAFKIYKSYPILGSGLKTFRKVCKKPEHYPVGCSTHPHNILMLFLSELGLIGIFFYLAAFLYFGVRIVQLFIQKLNNNFINNSPIITIIIVSIFMSLWPLSPSGNYFNNWISILNFLPISFLIHYEKDNFIS